LCVKDRKREREKMVCKFRVPVDGVPKNCGEVPLLGTDYLNIR